MEKNENIENKFYCPVCRIPECGGILKFKINKNNFSLNYECDKNKDHNGQNIYFKTFERFYLKEMNKDICKKCNCILENNSKYKCKLCSQIFCSSCFTLHNHIKKNINNILMISSKCEIHNNIIMYYCLDCKKYLCISCIKNSNLHIEHKIKNMYEKMPSIRKIKEINVRIKKYDDLLYSINSWMEEFNKRIQRLKQNILDEKDLLQKLIFNFNQNFINYSYFVNFNYIYKYSKNFNNEYLYNFSNKFTFEEKSKILFLYLFIEEKKEQIPKTEFKKINENNLIKCGKLKSDNIARITDNYFFNYSSKKIELIKFEIINNKFIQSIKAKKTFFSKIRNASVYKNLDNTYTIYACLSNNKKVAIIDIDLINHKLIMSNKEINKPGTGHFLKAIELNNDLIATFDNDNVIDIWIKDQENISGYTNINNITLDFTISNILSVNNDYFISSHSNKSLICFYDINNFSIVKTLNNIDCDRDLDSLLLYDNKYIIINCSKGFAVIYIKTKELVQLIEDLIGIQNFSSKEFILNSNNNNIYIKYKNEIIVEDSEYLDVKYEIEIFVLKYIDGSFQIVEKYEQFQEEEENLKLNYINDESLMLYDKNIYILK